MRNLNLDPFWRTSVGFDRLFDLMDESLRYEPEDNYPPCNIVRTGEDKYRISLAVAGFKPEQISVTVHGNTLTVAGRIGDLVSNDQMMLGVHDGLDIVAHDTGSLAACGHRTGVGIDQRDLFVWRSLHQGLDLLELLQAFFSAAIFSFNFDDLLCAVVASC